MWFKNTVMLERRPSVTGSRDDGECGSWGFEFQDEIVYTR